MCRDELAAHCGEVCPEVRVSCPYAAQGCTVTQRRGDLERHVQTAQVAHARLLSAAQVAESSRSAAESSRLREDVAAALVSQASRSTAEVGELHQRVAALAARSTAEVGELRQHVAALAASSESAAADRLELYHTCDTLSKENLELKNQIYSLHRKFNAIIV